MTQTYQTSDYAPPKKHARVECQRRKQGFTFGVFRDAAGQEWNDILDDTDENAAVAEGALVGSVGVEKAISTAGDLVWIPKGAIDLLKTLPDGRSVWLYGYGDSDGE